MGGSKPSVTLTFAGDATSLEKAAARTDQGLTQVGKAADRSGKQLADAGEKTGRMVTGLGHLGSAVTGAGDALDNVGGSLQAYVDFTQAGAERTARLNRALLDVEQAQEDYNQALRDSSQAAIDSGQAAIDLEQANLDAAVALTTYNQAVKEHGAGSVEAKQAALDLKQAQLDVTQAQEDQAQSSRDAAQATIDAKTAQQDLTDANREAHPPELAGWAENLSLITPLISAVVGVVGLVTAAQWLWNAALWASPITWIIVGVVALVAAIVLIATQTDWFQRAWRWAWGGIKDAAAAVWDWLKGAFGWLDSRFTGMPGRIRSAFFGLDDIITWPWRTAFNHISDAWNNTVGRLSWTVPGWVPGIGGSSVSAPRLPRFHTGGVVPGMPGQEVLAVLRAGERVTPSGQGGAGLRITFGGDTDGALAAAIMYLIRAGQITIEPA